MMRSRFALASSFAVLAFASTALAGDTVVAKDGWSSYGVGTTVTMKMTRKTITETEGASPVPEQVSESRMTLVKLTDKEYTLKRDTKVGEEWIGMETASPRMATEVKHPEGTKVEELGTESVTVDGTVLTCKKQRAMLGAGVTTTWTNDKHDVVKSESKSDGSESTMVLTKLSKKHTVAGKELDCREMTTTVKYPGTEMTVVSLLSDQIPGFTVRSDSVTKMPQAMTTSTTIYELVSFEIK